MVLGYKRGTERWKSSRGGENFSLGKLDYANTVKNTQYSGLFLGIF